ncbi:MAG TPA: hypothetical protein V6D28_05945 [Leptolyngbyaceae cyanobacterium]
MVKLNSVSQYPQLEQTDWVLQVLQRLLNIYSSVPNSLTFPDDSPTSFNHYEFIAILNACLERITTFTTFNNSSISHSKDFANFRQFQYKFAPKVENLERLVDSLEAPTTKLKGQYFY